MWKNELPIPKYVYTNKVHFKILVIPIKRSEYILVCQLIYLRYSDSLGCHIGARTCSR
jgi:hypothetical protein